MVKTPAEGVNSSQFAISPDGKQVAIIGPDHIICGIHRGGAPRTGFGRPHRAPWA